MPIKKNSAFFAPENRSVFAELLLEVLYFPPWWYGRGFMRVLQRASRSIASQYEHAGVGVWLKNLFVPMFGQYDWEGRLISFFIRIIQIIFRGIFFLIWILFVGVLVVLWLVIPVYTVYQIIRNGSALL